MHFSRSASHPRPRQRRGCRKYTYANHVFTWRCAAAILPRACRRHSIRVHFGAVVLRFGVRALWPRAARVLLRRLAWREHGRLAVLGGAFRLVARPPHASHLLHACVQLLCKPAPPAHSARQPAHALLWCLLVSWTRRRDPLPPSQAHRLAHPSSPLSAAPSSEQSGRMRRSTAQRLRHCAGASRRAQPHSP